MMALKNTLVNRLIISGLIGLATMLYMKFMYGGEFDLYFVLFGAVLAYIPITIVWAFISTFLTKEPEDHPDQKDD